MRLIPALMLGALLIAPLAGCDHEEREALESDAVAESARTDDAVDMPVTEREAPRAETHVDDDGKDFDEERP